MLECGARFFPCNAVRWHDVKGSMVIEGTYDEAVKMMGDISFLSSLTNFPKDCINDETVELLQPYFAAPDFNFDSAKKVASFAHNLRSTSHSITRVIFNHTWSAGEWQCGWPV